MKYLLAVLKDESEYARRSAVEVLNEIADPSTIRHLLAAIEDEDWWVRSRAADALATIGGPKGARCGPRTDSRQRRERPAIGHRNPESDQGRTRRRSSDRGPRRSRTGGFAKERPTRSAESATTKAVPASSKCSTANPNPCPLRDQGAGSHWPIEGFARISSPCSTELKKIFASRPSTHSPNSPTRRWRPAWAPSWNRS